MAKFSQPPFEGIEPFRVGVLICRVAQNWHWLGRDLRICTDQQER
jgi:hypothetical protein